ncbi:expressed unknown protein [Ectocarpus siliculosus]|uniref:Uncharacterized protein n=1 Tax=Ectocarpus siliculosus TaxID=2880 RepID=D7FQ64_ECTSI|nr:expressed unknown protein [Ectocarpus siliculosus]|eukprot:CBJ48396.1 expressed unknown protein [Ectocarpus siliculosus]
MSFPRIRRQQKFTSARRGSLCLREHATVSAAWRSASGIPKSRLRLERGWGGALDTRQEEERRIEEGAETMAAGLLMHGTLSFLSGLSVAITGFDCDSAREILTEMAPDSSAFDASSAINMGFSAGLVTAVQAVLLRRLINGALLLNTLPLTFIGVVLSLNVFSVSVLAALVPALGACLFGLSLAKLWMELADCRHETSVREPDDDRESSRSWKWTGVLSVASLTGGLLSGSCPPPGPAFMVVLLAAGVGGSGDALAVGGGEWRATAALVTCSASLLRVGLLLLENGAAVGPLPEGAAGGGGGGARGAYGKVAADDREAHEVELRPFVGKGTDDENVRGDEDYLDEEDGYLADEGETERSASRSSSKRGGGGQVEYSTLPPARRSSSGPPRRGVSSTGAGASGAAAPPAAVVGKEKMKEAPPAKSMFPAGHTVEL